MKRCYGLYGFEAWLNAFRDPHIVGHRTRETFMRATGGSNRQGPPVPELTEEGERAMRRAMRAAYVVRDETDDETDDERNET